MAKIRGLKKRELNMTQGNVVSLLVQFSLPLIAGNLFQQLYNMVDTWVVGNYVSNEAFSAVGAVGPIVNMLIGFFTGLSSGTGVVISQNYGAGDFKRVSEAVHTSITATVLLGVVFTVVGVISVPFMLRMMRMPDDVWAEASAYLRVYFAGILGLMLYNMGSFILRAIGDSRRPFHSLIISAVLNTGLDLLLVLRFHMGVKGVAYATIIAQFISALLTMIILLNETSCVHLSIHELGINWNVLKRIVRIGIPSAFQLALTNFSNVFVQGYINYFGSDCMSGWTAYSKIDLLVWLPIQSMELSSMTFVGQNLGVGNVRRVREGVRKAVAISLITTLILMAPLIIFAPKIVSFFNGKSEVVAYGAFFLRRMLPYLLLCCITHTLSGALRGAENSKTPMIIMLCSFVLFRQIYLYVMANLVSNTVMPIAMSYPAGWCVCFVLTVIYYLRTPIDKKIQT